VHKFIQFDVNVYLLIAFAFLFNLLTGLLITSL
jgi:hypothetical protein